MRLSFLGGLFAGFLAGTFITTLLGPSSAFRAGKKLYKISRGLKKRTFLMKRVGEKE